VNHSLLEDTFYINYYRIGQGAFRDKVKYYEDHKAEIHYLEVEQQYDVKIDYLLCLFEIGRYEYFLGKVDEMIETVIIENIFEYGGRNIYHDLLFRKSACLYNTNRLVAAEKVLKALIKLDTDNDVARTLYTRCRRKRVSPQNETIRYNVGKDIGFRLDLRAKLRAANRWFLNQSSGRDGFKLKD